MFDPNQSGKNFFLRCMGIFPMASTPEVGDVLFSKVKFLQYSPWLRQVFENS